MKNNQHILFIHIPKTAGTSFRVAAEEYYHKDNILYDYSPHFKETSKCVIEMVYENQDYYKLYKYIRKLENSFFSGHFHANKYNSLYDTLNVVSFVRDPVEQVISHYNHFKNNHNYEKSFREFIREQKFRNIQSKTLSGKHIALYGFLGLTEEYNASIDLFNAIYSTKLPYKQINIKKEGSLNREDIDEQTLELIRQLNAQDIEFYDSTKQQFQIRQELYAKNLPFTHAFLQEITEHKISGLAFQKGNDESIEIDIYRGRKYLKTVLSIGFRSGQVRNNVPRKGFIGFSYVSTGNNSLNGKLHAYIKKTGQEIF